MYVHSAICSCSVELYKLWYTLADFLPNWDISRGFLLLPLFVVRISEAAMCGEHYIFRVPRSSFIRDGEIEGGEIEEGGCQYTFFIV
jgi:hypothetical protein